MKKVVIFGGGSGLSQLLKGMVQFPWDVTAVVSMSDDGKSTGALRKEFDIPAVGDITKVLMTMSDMPEEVKDLFNYRFSWDSSLSGHSIKNLIMTAALEMKGDFAHSLPILCDLLDVKGKILPVTEDNVDLIGVTTSGKEIVGEAEITQARSHIAELRYSKPVHVTPAVLAAMAEADLIVFSSGSLVTSIMPNIIVPEIQEAVAASPAKVMYVCNIITQPGETDGFSVSGHVDALEQYLGKGAIDAVIANNEILPEDVLYLAREESKEQVALDRLTLQDHGVELIDDAIWTVDDNFIRHDALKTAYLMFSYLMRSEKE